MTPQEFAIHQQRQTDIKGFLNVIAPFASHPDTDLQKMAIDKAKELIAQISLDAKVSTIKPV